MKHLVTHVSQIAREWVGDGFPVRRLFSYHDHAEAISPFVWFDYAGPEDFPPTEHKRGIGPHPHRGMETVTIMYSGSLAHRDSAGGGGVIGPGDVQWMTAGAGVLHDEYHSEAFARQGGRFEAVQCWVNLPARSKMTSPSYQSLLAAHIPVVALPEQAGQLRVIAGSYAGRCGPARTHTPMYLWDMQLRAGHAVTLTLAEGDTAALFVRHGQVRLNTEAARIGAAELAILTRSGSTVRLEAVADTGAFFRRHTDSRTDGRRRPLRDESARRNSAGQARPASWPFRSARSLNAQPGAVRGS